MANINDFSLRGANLESVIGVMNRRQVINVFVFSTGNVSEVVLATFNNEALRGAE